MITEYPVTTASSTPQGITAGPDGSLWFTEVAGASKIGSITTAGVFDERVSTARPRHSGRSGITTGPDGALWFAENNVGQIGTITTSGGVTEFSMGISPSSGPFAITVGPDNNLWFTEQANSAVAVITTAGAVTEYPTSRAPSGLSHSASPRDRTAPCGSPNSITH